MGTRVQPIKKQHITQAYRYVGPPISRADIRAIERRREQRCWISAALASALVGALMILTQQVIEWRGLP